MSEQRTPHPEAAKEALDQARAEAIRLASAFDTVFGQPRRRSAEQQRVLDHLEEHSGSDQNSYQFRGATDGISRIAAGIHRDGAKSVLLVIERQLAIASKSKSATKTKPVVRR